MPPGGRGTGGRRRARPARPRCSSRRGGGIAQPLGEGAAERGGPERLRRRGDDAGRLRRGGRSEAGDGAVCRGLREVERLRDMRGPCATRPGSTRARRRSGRLRGPLVTSGSGTCCWPPPCPRPGSPSSWSTSPAAAPAPSTRRASNSTRPAASGLTSPPSSSRQRHAPLGVRHRPRRPRPPRTAPAGVPGPLHRPSARPPAAGHRRRAARPRDGPSPPSRSSRRRTGPGTMSG
jgi:hypothetical protein